jgi:hypothetical protein
MQCAQKEGTREFCYRDEAVIAKLDLGPGDSLLCTNLHQDPPHIVSCACERVHLWQHVHTLLAKGLHTYTTAQDDHNHQGSR